MPSKMPKSGVVASASLSGGGIFVQIYNDIETERYSSPSVMEFTEYGRTYTAEEICVDIARKCQFGSLAMHLFGLVTPDLKIWMPPNRKIACTADQSVTFVFRLRFIIQEKIAERLSESDPNAFNYYFLQCQEDFLQDVIPYEDIQKDHILGLVVINIIRFGKDHELNKEQLRKIKHKRFLPQSLRDSFKQPWDKKLLQINLKSHLDREYDDPSSTLLTVSASKLRFIYFGLFKYAPKYGCEYFQSQRLCISPRIPGIVCMKQTNGSYEVIATLSDLVDVSVNSSRTPCDVMMNRKTNIPVTLSFDTEEEALSFASCLDGYYRLSENFHHHICDNVKAEKFTQQVKRLRCHGPVSIEWAKQRLKERNQKQPDQNYLLKMKQDRIGSYALVHLRKNDNSTITVAILRLEDGRYQVELDYEPIFDDMFALLEYYRKGDHPRLKLGKGVPVASPTVRNGKYTQVMKGKLLKGSKYISVAVKQLRMTNNQPMSSDAFQALSSALHKVSFWSHGALVTCHALCLAAPFRGLMDFAVYGSLDQHLQHMKGLSWFDLFSATEQICHGISYLQDERAGSDGLGDFHGNLRCRNILVVDNDHHDGLQVKIADPGLVYMYDRLPITHLDNLERLPWIAPECYSNLGACNMYSERYALGMTIHEIFSKGIRPFPLDWSARQIQHHVLGNRPLPVTKLQLDNDEIFNGIEDIIQRCRDLTPENRLSPKEIIRDVRSVLHGAKLEEDYYSELQWKQTVIDKPEDEVAQNNENEALTVGAINHVGPFPHRELPKIPHGANFIDPSRIRAEKKPVGEGHFGQVFRGRYLNEKSIEIDVAIKVIKDDVYKDNFKEFEDESKMMMSLKHRNIVEIIGMCPDEANHMRMVMEYATHGSLNNYVRKEKPDQRTLLDFSIEIAEGMVFLSSKKVVHCDLAARNVLVFDGPSAKISDFGMARFLEGKDYYRCGGNKGIPLLWCAPEAMSDKKFTSKGDVWSFGVTLWEMFTYGEKPELDKNPINMYSRLHSGHRLKPKSPIPTVIYKEVLIPCWDFKPESRIDFEEARKRLMRISL